MTWYLWIKPLNEPQPAGKDGAGRPTWTFTAVAEKEPSATFEDEVVAVLEDALVGVAGETIFAGPNAQLPVTDAAFLTVVVGAGTRPGREQGTPGISHSRPSVTVAARCKGSSSAARTLIYQAHAALVAVHNQAVTA